MLESALKYAKELGWAVFPLDGKIPRVKKGFKAATTAPEQLEAWWEIWPRANIGLATGEVSGVVVLDIDGPEGENALKVNGFEIPDTWICETGRGRHIYFKHPGEHFPNSAGLLPKIDTRGDGGYSIIEPSIHPSSGKTYLWVSSPFDDENELADVPTWLFDLMNQGSKATTKVIAVGADDILAKGTRNDGLYRLACRWRNQNFEADAILALLKNANINHCKPPLSDAELAKIATSAATHEPGDEVPQQPSVSDMAKGAIASLRSAGFDAGALGKLDAQVKDKAKEAKAAGGIELEVVRRTHGKGRRAVFDATIFYRGGTALIKGVSGTTMLNYRLICGRAYEEGLTLPMHKTAVSDWHDLADTALARPGNVVARDQDEDATGAAVAFMRGWITDLMTEDDIHKVLAASNSFAFKEDGIYYYSGEALRGAIRREIPDARREDVTEAYRILGIVRTKVTKDGKSYNLRKYDPSNENTE